MSCGPTDAVLAPEPFYDVVQQLAFACPASPAAPSATAPKQAVTCSAGLNHRARLPILTSTRILQQGHQARQAPATSAPDRRQKHARLPTALRHSRLLHAARSNQPLWTCASASVRCCRQIVVGGGQLPGDHVPSVASITRSSSAGPAGSAVTVHHTFWQRHQCVCHQLRCVNTHVCKLHKPLDPTPRSQQRPNLETLQPSLAAGHTRCCTTIHNCGRRRR